MRWCWILALLLGCERGPAEPWPFAPAQGQPTVDAALPDAAVDAAPPPIERRTVAHDFGSRQLDAFQEQTRCVQWTLENTRSIYVERVALSTGGAFHHSNWFVVPEDKFPGEDGFFRCRQRGFDELSAALAGAVLFAQSTQSFYEEQRLGDGVVIKVPPGFKVVANVHMLNLSAAPIDTFLEMQLDLIHPRDVRTIVTPFRFSYLPLVLPPLSASRFTADCDLASVYERVTGRPFDLKVYWLLPHFHALGAWFDVTVRGGPLDGESIFRIEQFDAEPRGQAFDPPLDLTGATGLAVTCGYDNPRPVEVGWGIGDQEMCVMLGFAEAGTMLDASVVANSRLDREEFGIAWHSGPCVVLPVPKGEAWDAPGADELDAPLYLPPTDDPSDVGQAADCVDTPADAVAVSDASLEAVLATVFRPSCTFSACHGGAPPAADLDLLTPTEASLLAHPDRGDLALIVPGDAEASGLYQRISRCAPTDDQGRPVSHMPQNAPQLLDPGRVALVRDWINGMETRE